MAAQVAAGTMAMATAPTAVCAAQRRQQGTSSREGEQGAYTALLSHFILFFAVNLHLYLLSSFNVPTKLAQHYAKSLGSMVQLRLSKFWLKPFAAEPYVRAQLGLPNFRALG